jgi:hypothetical protein
MFISGHSNTKCEVCGGNLSGSLLKKCSRCGPPLANPSRQDMFFLFVILAVLGLLWFALARGA